MKYDAIILFKSLVFEESRDFSTKKEREEWIRVTLEYHRDLKVCTIMRTDKYDVN